MEKDIVPGLLELINRDFDEKTLNNNKVKIAIRKLRDKRATYLDANEFAIEVGEVLSEVLNTHITIETLPDGEMYFNIADRIMNETLNKNYDLITGYVTDVQTQMNRDAGFRLKGQKPSINQNRIDGIVERLSEGDFDKNQWLLNEPVVNFSQSIVDDTLKANIEFQAKSGLNPKIRRSVDSSDACKWCRDLEGIYDYDKVPTDIYRRHRFCRCTVEYYPGDGRMQNAHTKKWVDPEKNAKIAARKKVGVKTRKSLGSI